jgi:hypothetical protein
MELRGWKQIAYFLQVSERTAQSWKSRHDFPVHQIPGPKGRVFSTEQELDNWRLARPATCSPSRKTLSIRVSDEAYRKLRRYVDESPPGSTLQNLVAELLTKFLDEHAFESAARSGEQMNSASDRKAQSRESPDSRFFGLSRDAISHSNRNTACSPR